MIKGEGNNYLIPASDSESDSGCETKRRPVFKRKRSSSSTSRRSVDSPKSSAAASETSSSSSTSSSIGYVANMASYAGWMAQRAAALMGLARPPMDSTNSTADERSRHGVVAIRSPAHTAGSSGWLALPRWFWIPSSAKALAEAESQCFRKLKCPVSHEMVSTDDGYLISTVTVRPAVPLEPDVNRPPLVLLHGFAGGAGIWCKNLDALAADRTVFAIDMIGFGRSSRPRFSTDGAESEKLFVDSLEAWRRAMGLQSFILVGHSLGGFVAASYALLHPGRIEHLILVDCWGMPVRPENPEEQAVKLPKWIRLIGKIAHAFSPLSGMRLAGPLGSLIVRTLRPDLQKKYSDMFEDDTITNYIYHLNASPPSGELAMSYMSSPFGWAKKPMLPRLIEHLDVDVPVTLLYGQRSWVDCKSGYKLKAARPDSYVDVQIVERAGHHVYSDRSTVFNTIVSQVCARITDHLSSSAEEDDDSD